MTLAPLLHSTLTSKFWYAKLRPQMPKPPQAILHKSFGKGKLHLSALIVVCTAAYAKFRSTLQTCRGSYSYRCTMTGSSQKHVGSCTVIRQCLMRIAIAGWKQTAAQDKCLMNECHVGCCMLLTKFSCVRPSEKQLTTKLIESSRIRVLEGLFMVLVPCVSSCSTQETYSEALG